MIKNYFKTAIRGLLKKKTFSFLNIIGLAVGITCASLIFLWIEDELSYSHYFKKRDQLYQVMTNQTYDRQTFTFAATPGLLAPSIKEEIPGIKNVTRATWGERMVLSKEDKSLYADGLQVEPAFFSMFNLEFIQGNPAYAFEQLHSIVLNERMAKKIFNTTDVLGKMVKLDNYQDYVISGVYKSLPSNTRFEKLDWLTPFEIFLNKNEWLQQWGNNGIQTYVELYPEADPAQVNKKLNGFIQAKSKEAIAKPILLAANDWRLRSNFVDGKQSGGRIKYVNLFSIIAWIILLLACINFMNLSTARSEQRAREVGVRKVMGSGKRMLVAQFLTEAVVMSFMAVLLATVITFLLLPAFNKLVDKTMLLNLFNPIHIAFLVIIGLLCGLIAGSYPAFYLSSFNPIAVLKGIRLPVVGGVSFVRKGLVVTQFVISVGLIICTVIIYQQVIHTKNRELGLDKNKLVYMDQQVIAVPQNGNLGLHFNSIKSSLLSTGVVDNAALSNASAFEVGSNSSGFKWKGKDPGKEVLISMNWVTPGYIGTMGMQMMAGRDFYQDGSADSNNVVINESLAKLISKNPADAAGQVIDRDESKLTVIGVIKDYIYNNVYGPPAPLIIFNDLKAENTSSLHIRFKLNSDYKNALAKVEAVIKGNNPAYPFEYKFADEEFEKLFKDESLIGTLAAVFAGLAIFISSLGLFGLAAYTAERRVKEIGVRKVLGASVINLSAMLSKDFLLLVSLSCIVAFPVAWWIMHSWLQDFEYRVTIQWWMFALPAILAISVALITVSFQAIKSAIANPVKSLRTE